MKKLIAKCMSFIIAVSILIVLVPQTVNAASGTSDFVTRFYQLCLSRDPDPTGLQDWINRLESKEQSGASVAYGFVFSDEFKNRGVSDDEYVKIMYKAFFNRDPDPTGYANWMNAFANGMSRYYVLSGFTNSQEFINLSNSYGINAGCLNLTDVCDVYGNITAFVTRFYQQCLGRGADPTGLHNWVSNLQSKKQTGCDVAYGFVFSDEFINRNTSDDQFIKIMYKAFFNRDPDSTGYSTWMNYLDNGYTRHYVLSGFVNSPEFQKLCANYSINTGSLPLIDEDTSIGVPYWLEFERDSYGGTTLYWAAPNTSGKTINYCYVTLYTYNAVGDPASDKYTGRSYFDYRIVGPIAPDDVILFEELFTYNPTCYEVLVGELTLVFSDGMEKNVWYGYQGYQYNP